MFVFAPAERCFLCAVIFDQHFAPAELAIIHKVKMTVFYVNDFEW